MSYNVVAQELLDPIYDHYVNPIIMEKLDEATMWNSVKFFHEITVYDVHTAVPI